MARPRVFVSSTYYDLKYVRSSLEVFVDSLGYDTILSEKGDVVYSPDVPLDESCYREVLNSDIYVLIVGGRYGSATHSDREKMPASFYDQYESITKLEYRSARDSDAPIYVLIESSVYAEYHTYRKNKANDRIKYAHVDSVNVFQFIEEIESYNNPMQTFDKYSDIEEWLREQWAGLFRDLLHKRSNQRQLASLSVQVGQLTEFNKTLKRYLEEVMSNVVAPDAAAGLINSESERLDEAKKFSVVEASEFFSFIHDVHDVSFEKIADILKESDSLEGFAEAVSSDLPEGPKGVLIGSVLRNTAAQRDINRAREALELPRFTLGAKRNKKSESTKKQVPSES